MIDHTTGKSVPPIFNTKKSGNAVFLAIHVPNKAPINPTAIEMIQPPFENPASDLIESRVKQVLFRFPIRL